jgi:hypothetical protein
MAIASISNISNMYMKNQLKFDGENRIGIDVILITIVVVVTNKRSKDFRISFFPYPNFMKYDRMRC